MRGSTIGIVLAVCVSVLVASALGGCTSSGTSGAVTSGANSGRMMNGGGSNNGSAGGPSGSTGSGPSGGPGTMMNRGGSGTNSYSSVGQRIYLTGVGASGQAIPHSATRVAQGSLMMGGGGCGSCHGSNGRGGTIRMMAGSAIKVPDITYSALIKAGFTDATIRRAITAGLDESGKPLKDPMPRWRMSSAEVDAAIAYLKELNGR